MILPRQVEAAILAHALQAAPAECCGLLLGDRTTIVDLAPARNVADNPTSRYLIDPQEHFHAIRDARARALDVVGVYHSHPYSTATPSPTDCAEAFSGFIFLIVGLGSAPAEISAWTWADGNFATLPLVRFL